MNPLQEMDRQVFRFVNETLANPVFDFLMPVLSWNVLFIPLCVVAGVWLLVAGKGPRPRVCLALLLIVLSLQNAVVIDPLKKGLDRPRPFKTLADAKVRVGQGGSGSMPSAHAANWAAAAVVVSSYYPATRLAMCTAAFAVGFSRTYNGVHYPSDVLTGWCLGAAFAWLSLRLAAAGWRRLGRHYWPLWWEAAPDLLQPEAPLPSSMSAKPTSAIDSAQWLRLGYAVIALVLLLRLLYLASGKIELSEDEAYQWVWSKHPALSYYSKPPLIAYAQWLGTHLLGDTAFGIRFLSPLMAAVLSCQLMRFVAREQNGRAAFWVVVLALGLPLLAVGSLLLTVDPLSVLFWTLAMLAGWRAVRDDSTGAWLQVGLWLGLGFLSKYVALVQLLCFGIFFLLCPSARAQLRRPGPYLALLVLALSSLPVLIWNYQHEWITAVHLSERGGMTAAWKPTLRYLGEFLGAELFLLNPIVFIAAIVASAQVWRRRHASPLLLYLGCMGIPLFLFYLLWSFRSRVLPNWIAPSVLPILVMTVMYFESRAAETAGRLKRWAVGALVLGLILVIPTHESRWAAKLTGKPLPARVDPLRRVRGWQEMARVVGDEYRKLGAAGSEAFIIGDHYGTTSLLSFYLPEAKAGVPDRPLVYFRSSDRPLNQFFFWPGYQARQGQNALYVAQVREPITPPPSLTNEFESVRDLGLRDVSYRDQVLHTIQLFECRKLKAPAAAPATSTGPPPNKS